MVAKESLGFREGEAMGEAPKSACVGRNPREHVRASMFWERVDEPGRCWPWQGSNSDTTKDGYGRVTVAGEQTTAHRFMWEMLYGPLPDGLVVCHRCDNKLCVRPSHLFTGTPQQNAQDMVAKGRHRFVSNFHLARGKGAPPAEIRREIVARFRAGGVSQHGLAAEYGLSQSSVSKYIREAS